MIVLLVLFAAAALIYASVGFGGGSTYTALLAASSTDYQVLPIISLACNIVVVTGGVVRFARAGQIPWARALPLCALSVPLASVGGYLSVSEAFFTALLAVSLFAAGLLLFTQPEKRAAHSLGSAAVPQSAPRHTGALDLGLGGGLGLLSGIVGIGGGIFLAPVLHLTDWGKAKAVAGTASLFILVNSLAGMAGQLAKLTPGDVQAATAFWPLLLSVFVGGQIGSRLGVEFLPAIWIRRLTAVLVLTVSVRLLFHFLSLLGGT